MLEDLNSAVSQAMPYEPSNIRETRESALIWAWTQKRSARQSQDVLIFPSCLASLVGVLRKMPDLQALLRLRNQQPLLPPMGQRA